MKKRTKILLTILGTILALFIIVCGTLFYFACGSYTRRSINVYKELCVEHEVLPELNELGEYSDIKFRHFHQNYAIFCSDSYTLKVIYDDENYELQKNLLDTTYMFQSEPIENDINEYFDPYFTYDGFDFRILSLRNYSKMVYPKSLYFIGTDDTTNTIAYLYFEDKDIDSLISFEKLMESYVNWK